MKLDRTSVITLVVVIGAAVLLALLNQLTAVGSAVHVPTYVLALAGKYVCFAMLALSVDLVWGFAGILSLGHAAFFALGGYAMGMYLMRQIGTRGVYGNPLLPDFMVFLGWKELPWYWYGFDWFGFAMLMAIVVPALLAGLFGWLAFRSRVTGVYLSIITQALTYALLLAFFRNDMGFGGNNGLTDFKDIVGFNVQADSTRAALLVISALFLCAQFLLARFVVDSRFGKILIAVRDTESRTRFLGYRPESYKLVWVLSAIMAGIGGALYVPQVGIINPSEFAPGNSIEAVIWVAVGGRGTLVGAILGAIRFRPEATPMIVGLYITSAYWFTASTSFANPAVTIARSLSNTFAGIAPSSAPLFIAAQLVGAVAASLVFGWLLKERTAP